MEEQIPAKSLWECLEEIADPRSRQGRRYPLPGLLGMLILGALNGERSLRGMWMWGHKRWAEIARPLGFIGNPSPPVYNTMWYLVRDLRGTSLGALETWMVSQGGAGSSAISVDGKVQGGSRRLNPPQEPLEVMAAVGQELKVALGQEEVAAGGEVAAAVALLNRLPLRGKVVVADAGLLCRPVVEAIQEGGGDYLGLVKDNQPKVKEALDVWIEPRISPPGAGKTSG